MESRAYQTTPTPVLAFLPSLLATKTNRPQADVVFRFGDVEVNRAERIVRRAGAEVHLTPIEYCLLAFLIANVGRVITHKQILRNVWGPSHSEQNHYLRIYIGHLRQKLERDPAQPCHLLTESGVGYRLMPDA